jgi:GTPase
MQESDRTVSLIDLCGHEKYLKTTMHGMVAMDPNFAMIVIGSNMGL